MSFSSVSYGVESTPNLGESITTKTNLPSQLKAEDLQNIITVNEQFEETLENEENETIDTIYARAQKNLNDLIALELDPENKKVLNDMLLLLEHDIQNHHRLTEDKYKEELNNLRNLAPSSSIPINENATTSAAVVTYAVANSSVAAVYAYFLSHKYILSAELLAKARTNKIRSTKYYPKYIQRLIGTIAINAIFRHRPWDGGTALFQNKTNTIETDAYYAIRRFGYFKYRRNGKTCVDLADTYDYDLDLRELGSIQGIAINIMAAAQIYGILTPYEVRHTFVS